MGLLTVRWSVLRGCDCLSACSGERVLLVPRGVPVTKVRPVYPPSAEALSGAYCRGQGWPRPGFTPSPTLPSPWYLDLPGLAPALSSTLCEGHFQRPPLSPPPQVPTPIFRLRPEQPLWALARVGAAASISLLYYAGAAVGRSTLAGTRRRRGAGIGGACGGAGGGGEEGCCGQRLLGPRPAGPALPSCGFWWAVESQVLPEEGIVHSWVPGCSHPRLAL